MFSSEMIELEPQHRESEKMITEKNYDAEFHVVI